MKPPSVAVLLPCYNEAQTIVEVVRDFRNALPNATVYVYDNSSTDDSAALAAQAGAVVRGEPMRGKGYVMRSMFRDIEADCYVLADADDTYPAGAAPAMVNAVLDQRADMVVGDRLSSTYFTENKRRFHSGGNVLVRKLVNGFFGGEVSDIMTGYRAFSYSFVKSFPVLSTGFEIETEMTIFALENHLRVTSLPVEYRDRPEGSESKLSTVKDGLRVLRTIAKLFKDYRPMLFFNLLATICFVIGLFLGTPVVVEYFQTGLVPRFPSLFAAFFCLLAAMQLVVAGLILDTQGRTRRQGFEMAVNQLSSFRTFVVETSPDAAPARPGKEPAPASQD
ncbi:MAG: glycosyltransferase family 2 protein [Bifidobacteriaceae bacterium]|jgi:glycosyltransferase involved in cell wall biosynthesis|nr:glycosyltransferase family 2 protein [Bifidobacteriaceae bacterium]